MKEKGWKDMHGARGRERRGGRKQSKASPHAVNEYLRVLVMNGRGSTGRQGTRVWQGDGMRGRKEIGGWVRKECVGGNDD